MSSAEDGWLYVGTDVCNDKCVHELRCCHFKSHHIETTVTLNTALCPLALLPEVAGTAHACCFLCSLDGWMIPLSEHLVADGLKRCPLLYLQSHGFFAWSSHQQVYRGAPPHRDSTCHLNECVTRWWPGHAQAGPPFRPCVASTNSAMLVVGW